MNSRLQLDVCNLSLGRRHLVNAYEVKAGIGVMNHIDENQLHELNCSMVPQAYCVYISVVPYLKLERR